METEIILLSDSSEDSSIEIAKSSRRVAPKRASNTKKSCPRCQRMFCGTNGIISKACKHFVCKECIIDYYFKNQNFKMICQYKGRGRTDLCGSNLSETEVRSVLDEVGMNQLDETIVSLNWLYLRQNWLWSFQLISADSKFAWRRNGNIFDVGLLLWHLLPELSRRSSC